MASSEAQALSDLYGRWGQRFAADPAMDRDTTLDLYDGWARVTAEAEGVSYRTVDADGVPALWALPPEGTSGSAVLFGHGGGYFAGSPDSHRKLAGHVAKAAGVPVLVYGYRLVPEHQPFPDPQLEDTERAFHWILASGVPAHRVALIGDSAGAALVTLFALRLRNAGRELPAAVVALSPMYDLLGESDSLTANLGKDLLTTPELIRGAGKGLLGPDRSAADPAYNPLKADLAELPPFFLSVGSYEGLLDDSRRFAERAQAAGVSVELEVVPEMQHVFHFLAGNAPEADESIAKIGRFLRQHLTAGVSRETANSGLFRSGLGGGAGGGT
jgi:acetyl esterase/lipase